MNREDIIKAAQESGLYSNKPRTPGTESFIVRRLERFVDLITRRRWISVKDQLPDIDSHVLVVWRDGFVSSTTFRGLEWNDITHWTCLPEPPEVEG